MFHSYLASHKKRMLPVIQTFFADEKQKLTQHSSSITVDLLNRLMNYTLNGKMTRSALVYIGAEIAGIETEGNTDLATIALSMELFQSGFLIHDDIIDGDELRRGMPSIHTQYTQLLTQMQSRYPKNSGKALGIQAGTIAFFLGYEAVEKIKNQAIKKNILSILTPELIGVALGQMQDVMMSVSHKPISDEKQIIALYTQKTGKYSISLPLHLGLAHGNPTSETLRHIYSYGNNLGVAYQITDDMLNLFGDPKATGKPRGSDIREGKQTLWHYHLCKHMTKNETQTIQALREKGTIDEKDISSIQYLVKQYNIDKKMIDIQRTYIRSATEAIEKIPMKTETRAVITSFTQFVTNRVQ